MFFSLPLCLKDLGTSVTSVLAGNLNIGSFAPLPSSMRTFTCATCKFESNSTDDRPTNSGFNESAIAWPLVWELFPNLTTLQITSSYLPSLPAPIPSRLSSLVIMDNKLNLGVIPSDWFANFSSSTITQFNIRVNDSPLSANLPPDLFAPFTTISFTPDVGEFTFDLRGSQLEGPIPHSLFMPLKDAGLQTFIFFLSDNDLIGTIPSTLFPSGLMTTTAYSSSLFDLKLERTGLDGSIPDNLLSNISARTVNIDLSANRFSGTIPSLGMRRLPYPYNSMALSLYNNLLHGNINSSIIGGESLFALMLDLSGNPRLNGSIANDFFLANYTSIFASSNFLKGLAPPKLSNTTQFDLSNTLIDFCSVPLAVPPNGGWNSESCVLDDTTAACDCPQHYTGCSLVCSPVPSPVAVPAPFALPTELCMPSTRPNPDFICIGGVWTAPNASSPILNIPSGAGPIVVILGNVSSTSLIFNNIGTTLSIGGCATNLTTVTIQLTEEQVKKLGSTRTLQTLVELSNASSCVGSLAGVAVEAKVTHGCRRVKTERQVSSDGKTLSSFFSVDSSGCNRWWIILVSVICGVIVIAIVAVVLLAILSPKFRELVRPFSRRRAAQSNVS